MPDLLQQLAIMRQRGAFFPGAPHRLLPRLLQQFAHPLLAGHVELVQRHAAVGIRHGANSIGRRIYTA